MKKNIICPVPPMGWNSWDCYGASVTEEEVMGNAQYVKDNLAQFGWEYIVVDIQWYEPGADGSKYHAYVQLNLDEYGRPLPAVNRFPSAADGHGFKALGDAIHSMGLKFGIHMMRGVPRQAAHLGLPIHNSPYTCRDIATEDVCRWNFDMYGVNPRHPGARDWYRSQAELWASWGVDYVKVDDIAAPHYHEEECELIRDALDATGRDIALSLSPGNSELPRARHYMQHAQAWRISNDFWDTWRQLKAQYELCAAWAPYVTEGHWPDADMLPLGHLSVRGNELNVMDRRTRFTPAEQVSMMSLWCLIRSPLMLGGELRDNTPEDLALISNAAVLDVSRKSRNPRRAVIDGDDQIWVAECADGGHYLLLLNTADYARNITFTFAEAGIPEGTLSDLWTGETAETGCGVNTVTIDTHGARLFRVQ